ncbi:MAG: dihydrodipicolinate synthase family protein [Anaerolineae bacterium]|nr:dihydrodipicolinate synthase family protein [Anaerolineae bacterium]
MTEAERAHVAEIVVRQVAARVPVIVHVGALATPMSVRLAQHARTIGANAVAAIPPFYYHVGTNGIEAHYRAIAQVGLPLYIYNIPNATNVHLDAAFIARLWRKGVVRGLKFTSYDQLTFREIIEACGPEFNVIPGPDEMLLSFLVMGAHGGIGTTYNFMPWLYKNIFAAWTRGDLARAQALQFQANRIIVALRPFGVIPATKAVMRFLGVDCGNVRAPFVALNDEQQEQLRAALDAAGYFTLVAEMQQ